MIHLRRRLVALTLPLLMAACGHDSSPPSKGECSALVDHLGDLEFEASRPLAADEAATLAQHRAAVQAAASGRLLDECQRLSSEQVECSLRASSRDELAGCLSTAEASR